MDSPEDLSVGHGKKGPGFIRLLLRGLRNILCTGGGLKEFEKNIALFLDYAEGGVGLLLYFRFQGALALY